MSEAIRLYRLSRELRSALHLSASRQKSRVISQSTNGVLGLIRNPGIAPLRPNFLTILLEILMSRWRQLTKTGSPQNVDVRETNPFVQSNNGLHQNPWEPTNRCEVFQPNQSQIEDLSHCMHTIIDRLDRLQLPRDRADNASPSANINPSGNNFAPGQENGMRQPVTCQQVTMGNAPLCASTPLSFSSQATQNSGENCASGVQVKFSQV